MSAPPESDGKEPKRRAASRSESCPLPAANCYGMAQCFFRSVNRFRSLLIRTIKASTSTRIPTPAIASTIRSAATATATAHRHSKTKTDTATAVSEIPYTAWRQARAEKAVSHGVAYPFVRQPVCMIPSAFPDFLILYLFFTVLSIGFLPVISMNFHKLFSYFTQNRSVRLQFAFRNPANQRGKRLRTVIFQHR